ILKLVEDRPQFLAGFDNSKTCSELRGSACGRTGMDKLRILDEAYLPIVTKPSRYTGSFLHAARKNPADAKVKALLCFPDLYEVGLPCLVCKVPIRMLNKRTDAMT